ncbi:MAG: hypothetical protein C0392_16695 [Syntrophus sp. (in: bacteria)]|nr:hypothetical protein [Syntrophus sp. (in: bacteria)]
MSYQATSEAESCNPSRNGFPPGRHGLNTFSVTIKLKGLLSGISALFLFAAAPFPAHASTLWAAGETLPPLKDMPPAEYITEKLLTGFETVDALLVDQTAFSETRFDRMGYLLKNYTQPFTIEYFITLGQDKAAGVDNSILSTGSTHDKKRTLANWIVLMPREGPPELHVSLFGPDDTVKELDIRLDRSFWTEGLE